MKYDLGLVRKTSDSCMDMVGCKKMSHGCDKGGCETESCGNWMERVNCFFFLKGKKDGFGQKRV